MFLAMMISGKSLFCPNRGLPLPSPRKIDSTNKDIWLGCPVHATCAATAANTGFALKVLRISAANQAPWSNHPAAHPGDRTPSRTKTWARMGRIMAGG